MRGPQTQQTNRARRLRRNATDAESKLWWRLRARQLSGFKFVRQEPVGPYVADFMCREAHLIVEVDGGQHAGSERDQGRDRWLTEQGHRVLRFWNNDVLQNMSGVLEAISAALQSPMPHPDRRGNA